MGYKDPEKQKQYGREWLAKRRQEFFKDKACVRCESTFKLELDHVDPDQKISHSIWSWSASRRLIELAKCQVLCKLCHLNKTKRQRLANVTHGRDGTYTKFGCRCEKCKYAHHVKRVNDFKEYGC